MRVWHRPAGCSKACVRHAGARGDGIVVVIGRLGFSLRDCRLALTAAV